MAEVVISPIAQYLLEKLSSLVGEGISSLFGLQDELEKLQETVLAIQAVLLDADEKRDLSNQEKNFVQRLKDVLYDADDLLDRVSLEAVQGQQDMAACNAVTKKVCIFFAMPKLAYEVKKIREQIDLIVRDSGIKIELCQSPRRSLALVDTGETSSKEYEEHVIGREEEVAAVKKFLLNSDTEDNVSLIALVGMGGLGKTTLAWHAFSDSEVKGHFDRSFWVCVSNKLPVKIIIEKIIRSATGVKPQVSEMEPLLQDLQRGIGKIKYLLVLDDVWDDDRESWNMLKAPLSSGAKGSKILLTTRSKRVGDAAGVGESCNLEGLSEGDSWELLKKIAFQQRQHESNDPELVKIGKLIVRKCGGVPLALKTMGGLLSNKTNEEWLQFQDQELSTITQAEENDIFPMLKLSYDHLQPNLRQCFAYCSLFPKDYWFFKERLIRLWIAQGFIQSSTRSQSLEGVGNQYFMHLLHMSFFQEPEKDSLGNIKAVKMHDLMHDIAVGVAKSECLHIDRCVEINRGVEIIREKVRHVSSHYGKQTTSRDLSSALCYANRVRTMFYIELNSYSSFKHLRALELAGMKLMAVPKSICGLKSLRYLDISNNNHCSLPNCIATLINLQTLDLGYNFDLRELPEDLKDLGNLRHLVLDECYDLICMPCGIDKLSCLQTLSKFVVGCDASSKFSADISELTGLNNLRGTLKIVNSRNRISKFKPEVLQNKKGIEILEIDFGACSEEKEMVVDDEALLKGVLDLSNLRNLKFTGYNVKEAQNTQRLSFQLPSLVKFEAYESKCKYLPNFGHLPNLKFIDISYLTRLTYLPPINHLNSLVSINLKELATLQQIPILDQLHLLKSVTFNHLMAIKDLPKLHELPLLEHLQLEKLTSLEYIQEEEVEEEEKHYVSSSLHSNSNSAVVAATLPLFFPSLKSLLLRRIPNLKGWWKRVNSSSSSSSSSITALHFPVLSKLSIFVCPNLMSMPFFPCVESLSLTVGYYTYKICNIIYREVNGTYLRNDLLPG